MAYNYLQPDMFFRERGREREGGKKAKNEIPDRAKFTEGVKLTGTWPQTNPAKSKNALMHFPSGPRECVS